jgi:hypothetical protein
MAITPRRRALSIGCVSVRRRMEREHRDADRYCGWGNRDTGAMRWSTEGRNATSAAVVAAGRHLVFLTTDSQMVVTPIDPDTYRELRRYTVASSSTYAHPIVLRDSVIVRDMSNVTLWSLR